MAALKHQLAVMKSVLPHSPQKKVKTVASKPSSARKLAAQPSEETIGLEKKVFELELVDDHF